MEDKVAHLPRQVGPSLRVGAVSKEEQQHRGGFVLFGDVAAGCSRTRRPAARHSSAE